MSLAIAVRIAASSVRSSAGRGRRRRGGARKSATTSIASVAEPPLPSASSRPPASKRARSAAAAAASASALLGQRLLAQRRRPRRPSSAPSARTSARTASRSSSLLGQERVEEARRARVVHRPRGAALEQAAVLEEHVHELPQHVVERLDQLLARRTGPPGGANSHSAPTGAKAIVRQPRAPRAPARGRLGHVGAEGDHDVVGLGRPASTCAASGAALARPARAPAARACRRSPGARTRPRRGARPSAPPACAPSASSRPPRGEALGHPVAEPRDPLGLGREERARSPACARRAGVVDGARARSRSRRGAAPAPGSRASQSRNASTPSPVRALTSMPLARPGAPRRGWRRNRSRSKSRCGSRSILLISTSSQARNISGYLSGLSSPSVTEETITRASSPTRNSAGQTRLPTFSTTSRSSSSSGSDGQRRAHHVRVEVALAAEARVRC